MGSLLPGWDANGTPEGYTEDVEEPSSEPLGYFAKLEKTRSMRQPAEAASPFVAALPHAYSLHRHSLVHDPSLRTKTSAESSPPEARASLRRISASATDSPASHSRPHAHLRTDWAEELYALGGGHKVERTLDKGKGEERWSFARHMEHSVLNEPAADNDSAAKGKGFVPQFAAAGQPMQYAAPLAG